MKRLFIASLLPLFLAACSNNNENSANIGGNPPLDVSQSDLTVITVKNFEGKPLAGAQILIGDAANVPFSGNFLTTNAQGQAEAPSAWTSAESVTVAAPGYVRSTYIAQAPHAMTVKLKKNALAAPLEMRGNVTGLQVADFDKYVDFGIVMPALSRLNVLLFDINSVVSQQSDNISVIGQTLPVPSNISLPRQKERYGILTATLDKPSYRIYFDQPGVNRLYTLRGRFAFSPVVDALRKGGSFVGLINQFQLTGGGMRDINVTAASASLDLPANELNFTARKTATAPSFNPDETFLAVAGNMQSGYIVPTDLKTIGKGQTGDLAVLPTGTNYLLGVLKKTSDLTAKSVEASAANPDDPMSTTIIPFDGTVPKFLPLITGPRVSNTGDLILPKIASVSGIRAVLTYSVLSQLKQVVQGGQNVKVAQPVWEVYAPQWVSGVKMPEWPRDTAVSGSKRWEVSFLGSTQSASQDQIGPAMIEASTHATHSVYDF